MPTVHFGDQKSPSRLFLRRLYRRRDERRRAFGGRISASADDGQHFTASPPPPPIPNNRRPSSAAESIHLSAPDASLIVRRVTFHDVTSTTTQSTPTATRSPSRSPRHSIGTVNRRVSRSGSNVAQKTAEIARFGTSFALPKRSSLHSGQIDPLRRESVFLKSDAVFKAYEQSERLRNENAELKDAANPRIPSETAAAAAAADPPLHRSTSLQSAAAVADQRRRCSAFVAMDSLKRENTDEVYNIHKQLGTGRFGFVKLAEHRQSGKQVALKFFPRPQCKQADFLREFNSSKFLCAHQNIIDTFDGIFQSTDDSAFYFVQEFCPNGSVREMVEKSSNGIGEAATKSILLSVLSAVDFMHNEGLVHRNLKPENILVFNLDDLSRVKISDFGLTRKVDTKVKHLEYTNQYHAPELCDTVVNEVLTVGRSIDIWAIGIIFYYCLKGKHPWQKASIMCKPYWEWEQWMKHKLPQLPRRYEVFTEKAIKLQKRCLIARSKDRWECRDIKKCLEKETLLKPVKAPKPSVSPVIHRNVPKSDVHSIFRDDRPRPSKSTIHKWIHSTLSTMAEISEQVVSARDQPLR